MKAFIIQWGNSRPNKKRLRAEKLNPCVARLTATFIQEPDIQ